jgi:hypothetical protein
MKTIFLISAMTFAIIVNGQVKQNIIVEHFTNTYCSACASRNPGFYSNLDQNPEVRHIAYHPSAPYSACFFSKQNKIENDDRPKYYGIFGSTPRLVIQGTVISGSTSYSTSAIFNPFLDKTSPIQIRLNLVPKGVDSISVSLVLSTKGSHSLGNLRLFAALVEKEVAYAASNGESVHRDVFRKSFFETIGMQITLSNTVGDSVKYTATILKKSDWVTSQLYAVAILNKESDKSLVQTDQSNLLGIASGLSKVERNTFDVYPNPAANTISITLYGKSKYEIKLIDITGKLVLEQADFIGGDIDISHLPKGVYFIQLNDNDKWISKKIIKQ